MQEKKTEQEAKETLLVAGQKEWLNPNEVHLIFGLSVSTLAKWRMKNLNLTFSKIGNYIKYKRSDIEAFLESNKVEVQESRN